MRTRIATFVLALLAIALPAWAGEIPDFSFVQISDIHVDIHRAGANGPVRGQDTIDWLCNEIDTPQHVTPLDLETPPPAFVLATGDLTEFGVFDQTWLKFEHAFGRLPCPLYVLPGNHDNTWHAMYDVMRKKHGGANYSFDRFGCHFVCISSASPQEPVPTIDATTRAWLRADLARVAPETPVFLAMHHPLYSNEFANPAECDTFLDLLRDHNIALMLYGHGHGVNERVMEGIQGVMGGSTFGPNAGYSVISVIDGTLRVTYRYHQTGDSKDKPEWKVLVEKKLSTTAPRRLFSLKLAEFDATQTPKAINAELAFADSATAENLKDVAFLLNGEPLSAKRAEDAAKPTWRVRLPKRLPGHYLLTVRATLKDGTADLRTTQLALGCTPDVWRWRRELPAAAKAGPVATDKALYVAGTDGVVRALNPANGETMWQFATGGEILGTPSWANDLLVFGSGDGNVYAIDADGKQKWSYAAGAPVYGAVVCADGTAYVGDNAGHLHALNCATGEPRWVFADATFGIEEAPCVWGDKVAIGAWDGNVYCVKRDTGELVWKTAGPKSSDGKAARYYAPADCGPVAVRDRLYVCDRGYLLAEYDAAGQIGEKFGEKISAISAFDSGRGLVCRSVEDRLACYRANDRQLLWETAVPAGRFPITPTIAGDRVYVCSNTGTLSAVEAETGKHISSWQITAGQFVMAPVATGPDGTCFVAGMDGSMTALRP